MKSRKVRIIARMVWDSMPWRVLFLAMSFLFVMMCCEQHLLLKKAESDRATILEVADDLAKCAEERDIYKEASKKMSIDLCLVTEHPFYCEMAEEAVESWMGEEE